MGCWCVALPVQNQPALQLPVGALSPAPSQYIPGVQAEQAATSCWVESELYEPEAHLYCVSYSVPAGQ